MCKLFIEEVLGCSSANQRKGIYGDTNAYYGTVEQQGRLTLHLHMLIWIKGVMSPQDVRDSILNPDSKFQKKMVEWLEGCHMGELFMALSPRYSLKWNKTKRRLDTSIRHGRYLKFRPKNAS